MGTNLLDDKVALITGATKGIGAEIAHHFAKEHASLILVGRNEDKLHEVADECRDMGAPAAEVISTDLADGSAISGLCEDVLKRHGHIDVLVNNAGIASWEGQGPTDGDPEEWSKMIKLNVEAPMRFARAISPSMVKRRSGVIINIGSVAGVDPNPMQCVYSACKFGVRGWSLSCYEALRTHGVKVVLIQPGYVQTPMTSGLEKLDGNKMIQPADVAEAVMLALRTSPNCVPAEIILRIGPDVEKEKREE